MNEGFNYDGLIKLMLYSVPEMSAFAETIPEGQTQPMLIINANLNFDDEYIEVPNGDIMFRHWVSYFALFQQNDDLQEDGAAAPGTYTHAIHANS